MIILFPPDSGIGIEMTQPLYQAPCLADTLLDRVFAQNLPSIVCGHVVDPKPGELILDMCAAPGKSLTFTSAFFFHVLS